MWQKKVEEELRGIEKYWGLFSHLLCYILKIIVNIWNHGNI